MSNKQARIVIVDDHPVVRFGITQMIEAEEDLTVCAEAESAREGLEKVKAEKPDLVIVDLSLKEASGLDLIKAIKAALPGQPVLVLSMHDEALYAERSLRAGARGYVMKQAGTETLIKAIRAVLSGRIHLSDEAASSMIGRITAGAEGEEPTPVSMLSDRELEVFEMIGRGKKTRQIADGLGLSVKTIETYRANIKQKLNLENASQLASHATVWVNSLGQG